MTVVTIPAPVHPVTGHEHDVPGIVHADIHAVLVTVINGCEQSLDRLAGLQVVNVILVDDQIMAVVAWGVPGGGRHLAREHN